MSQDQITISLGLPELRVLEYHDRGSHHEIWVEKIRAVIVCPECGTPKTDPTGEVRFRQVQDLPICGRPVWLQLRQRRFLCAQGHRFWERFDTVALKQRQTRRFQQWLLCQVRGSSIAEGVRRTGVGYRVLAWLVLKVRERRMASDQPWPRRIGIDEYSFRRGHHYDTVVVDLKGHDVFEVTQGRSAKGLTSLWEQHPGKKRIRQAVIDMSQTFFSALKALGHRVVIAIDRFHVERHVFDAVDAVRLRLQRTASPSEQKRLKAHRGLLRQNGDALSEEDRQSREMLLRDYPELAQAVALAERLHRWYDRFEDINRARGALAWWLGAVQRSDLPELIEAAQALRHWFREILNSFGIFLTNGPVEGLIPKIKLVLRKAFGLPCFQHRRTRILFECGPSP